MSWNVVDPDQSMTPRQQELVVAAVRRAARFCSLEKAIEIVGLRTAYSFAEVRGCVEKAGLREGGGLR